MTYPDNPSFCTAPWVHLHLLPNGKAMPCCFWDQKHKRDDFGNINDFDTVEDLFNHEGFKKLRLQFLEGKRHPGCNRCYIHEDAGRDRNSMRYWFNDTFVGEKSKRSVAETTEDGSITPDVVYLDIRYGNICNLKCRMCGYELSSTWHEELIKLEEFNGVDENNPRSQRYKPKFIHVDAYDKIEPFLEHAEEIYFAGGEPLLYPEHTKMLDKLVETGNTKCRIKYNTNLSSLSYKGRDIVDLWKKFDQVSVGASIDAMEDPVEYIRTNLNWNTFVKNFERVRKEAPLVHLFPAPTIGVLNVEVFPEFNRFCIENNWSKFSALVPNFVTWPEWQHPCVLPRWYRDRIIHKYEQHIEWCLDEENNGVGRLGFNQVEGLRSIISYLQEEPFSQKQQDVYIDQLWKRLWAFHVSSGENWSEKLTHLFQFFMEFKERQGWKEWPDNWPE